MMGKGRERMSDHYDRYNGMEELLSTNLAEVGTDVPDIIYCKDCEKHNKGVGDFEITPDGKRTWIWKDRACPLVSWRGSAQGHEFDYQFCAFGERRTE